MIQPAHFLAGIDQQREREAALGLKSNVALRALRVYAEHQRVVLLRGRPAIAKFAQLPAADGSVVARIKHEHDVAAAQGGKRYHLAILIGKREIGRKRTDGQRIGEEPVEQTPLL